MSEIRLTSEKIFGIIVILVFGTPHVFSYRKHSWDALEEMKGMVESRSRVRGFKVFEYVAKLTERVYRGHFFERYLAWKKL